jgi:hypothetical protein
MSKRRIKNKINSGQFKTGHKNSKNQLLKVKLATTGDKSYAWKGDKIGYYGLHKWVNRWKGKSNLCEVCGTTKAKKYEWANIDHKYRRVLEDYIRMCTSCHRKYDFSKGIKIN